MTFVFLFIYFTAILLAAIATIVTFIAAIFVCLLPFILVGYIIYALIARR